MKKILGMFLWLAVTIALTGCIKDFTPKDSVIELDPGESQTFKAVSDDPSAKLVWYLDGKKVLYGKNTYTYTAEANATDKPIVHKLVVREEGGRYVQYYQIAGLSKDFMTSVTWTIKVLPQQAPACEEGETRETSCGVGACASTGIETCTNGEFGGDTCVPGEPSQEILDGVDNDCDGQVDEGVACTEGETRETSCGVGACAATGIETCVNGQFTGNTCVAGQPAQEVCDGIDNNCNGTVDDGIEAVVTTCGIGACANIGALNCVNGELIDSCVAAAPTAEICDGIDNDCNGMADDGIAAAPSTCGVGACASTGEVACVSGAPVDSCQPGTPSIEIGDGIDNDCDGQVDEGIACIEGDTRPTACGVGACASTGIETCVNGQFTNDTCMAGAPSAEQCDGIDNNCNGSVDDGIAATDTSCGVGACASTGTLSCVGGQMVDSCVEGTPTAEVCDGIDNNCNGVADDGIAATPSNCGVGACASTGEVACVAGAPVDSCQPGMPSTEIGDGIDNDCDGQVDEGIACMEGDTRPTACGVGACASTGTETCVNGQFTNDTCVAGAPTAEQCDGIDNNCNGIVDDGIAATDTTCGVGACASTGTLSCVGGQMVDSCVEGTPTAEVCDGIDNNCNGATDDGIAAAPSTCGVGACASNGEIACVSGTPVDSCQPGLPSAEIGDGIDNDCDGQVDEGIACMEGDTRPTTCGVGACAATGTETCVNGQFTNDTCVAGTATAEQCDNIDNNCNGIVDDGIAATDTTCGVGACASTGTLSCVEGQLVDSCVEGTPTAEACNLIDDDCDGTVDNGIASTPTTCGVGACASTGTTSCVEGQLVDSCVEGTPTAEACNLIDDDCDGTVDNGIASTPTTCGVGACASTGTYACVEGQMTDSCQALTPGPAEICDNTIDDNCDGLTDGEDTVACAAGPPGIPTNVQATDCDPVNYDPAHVNITITWDEVDGADYYRVSRAIFSEDNTFEVIAEHVEGTSYEYVQTWQEDVLDIIGPTPGLSPTADFDRAENELGPPYAEREAFIAALNDYREMALPTLFNFKAPAFFRVEACNSVDCSDPSVADAGSAEYVHTEQFSDLAQQVIPSWGYAQLVSLADAPPGAYGLGWCGIDLCGSGGGIAMGRVMATTRVNIDVLYDNFTETLDSAPGSYFNTSGRLGGRMAANDANNGKFTLSGTFTVDMTGRPQVGLAMNARIGYTATDGTRYSEGVASITYKGLTYQFSLPIQPIDGISGHAAAAPEPVVPAEPIPPTTGYTASTAPAPTPLIPEDLDPECERSWPEYVLEECPATIAP